MTDLVLGSLINQSGQFVFSNVIVSGGIQTSNLALTTGTTVGTGMYSPSNNTLSLTTNNAQQLTISSAGDVGINNPTPTNTTGYTTLQITNAVNGGLLRINNASQNYVTFVNSAGAFGGTVSGDPVITIVNNTERMRVTTLGNVGIGSVSPNELLTVAGAVTSVSNANNFNVNGAFFDYYSGGARIAAWIATGSNLQFYTNPSLGTVLERMRITSLGNVGIGTITVAAGNAVSVFGGNIQVGSTGNGVKFADGTYQSTAYTGAVAASGTLIRAPQVLTSGTSYTTPAGCNHILIEMIGGGGGGGGCPGSSSGTSYGGGGGSSVFAVKYATVTPSTTYTYAIGGLGSGAGGGGNGSAGGTTSISIGGVTYSCSGGGGGSAGSSGVGGAVGAVGTASNMDYVITNLNNANAYQGGCVTTPYGINLGGFNLTGPSQITSGVSGYGFGAGGGGAYNSNYSGAGAQSGGNGYQGMIRIWEYT